MLDRLPSQLDDYFLVFKQECLVGLAHPIGGGLSHYLIDNLQGYPHSLPTISWFQASEFSGAYHGYGQLRTTGVLQVGGVLPIPEILLCFGVQFLFVKTIKMLKP